MSAANPAQARAEGRAEAKQESRVSVQSHESFLVYARFRYMKWAVALVMISLVVYIGHKPILEPRNGGTWAGYALGTVGALLILWLMWFGVRKRQYAQGPGRLEDWLSAHVYLGLALIAVGTLHAGFQFGLNVHTLAYGLMLGVIGSGIYGVYVYMRYPQLITVNRAGSTTAKMLNEIVVIDGEARNLALNLGEAISAQVVRSVEETRIGGSAWRQLSGRDPRCATASALTEIDRLANLAPPDQLSDIRKLLVVLTQKNQLLRRLRRDIQLKAKMEIWLFFHVPLSFTLLAALIAHIVAVFFYW